jgi:hypothetical protein
MSFERDIMPVAFSSVISHLHVYKGFKGQWQRKFLLAISILLDNQTMKILSFPSRTF